MGERSKLFHISDVLSITHDQLFSTRHMEGIYDICNFLTGDNLFTHQLPRVHEPCKIWLRTIHPALNDLTKLTDAEVETMKATGEKEWWKPWLDAQVQRFGEYLKVRPIDAELIEHKDPIEEAVEMFGKDRVIGLEL